MKLIATLPRWPDRGRPGGLVAVDDDGNTIHRCAILGKSDGLRAAKEGNPSRKTILPFGDTPTGLWACVKGSVVAPSSTYGTNPVIKLTPVSGDAVLALKRRGIWLHGGAPGTAQVYGYLRPTFGCLRVADDDMQQIWALSATFGEPETLEVKESV